MMYEKNSINKRPLGRLCSPVELICLSSFLFLGLMIGHMSAYPWTSTHTLPETEVLGLMKTVAFEFMGERSTYWHLYFGWGLLVGVLLLALAVTYGSCQISPRWPLEVSVSFREPFLGAAWLALI